MWSLQVCYSELNWFLDGEEQTRHCWQLQSHQSYNILFFLVFTYAKPMSILLYKTVGGNLGNKWQSFTVCVSF